MKEAYYDVKYEIKYEISFSSHLFFIMIICLSFTFNIFNDHHVQVED